MRKRKILTLTLGLVAGCLAGSRPLTLRDEGFCHARHRNARHDFHVSVTQMQYNPKGQSFEISLRIFTDDLEKALSADAKRSVHLTAADQNDALLEKYVRAHFAYVNPQKQPQPFTYVGHEVEVDANWLYLEMPYPQAYRGGLMKQNVLMELFDDQVNMVNIQYQGQKKTFMFRKNQPIQDVSI